MGLIPATELRERRDWHPQPGEAVSAAIVSLDAKEHKMLLTLQPETVAPTPELSK